MNDWRRFAKMWTVSVLAAALVISLFNFGIDPYLRFGWTRVPVFNARKPAVDTQQRLMKAYDVLRAQPKTILLGSSRVDWGLDAGSNTWPAWRRPVYNLGIPNSGPEVYYRYLQHVFASATPSLVVVGLEFTSFLKFADHANLAYLDRLAGRADERSIRLARQQELRDALWATFSLESLLDSSSTVLANLRQRSSNMAHGDWYYEPYEALTERSGSYPLVMFEVIGVMQRYTTKPGTLYDFSGLGDIIDICIDHHARVIFFITPSHAYDMESIALSGYWPAFEDWKKGLAEFVSAHQGRAAIDQVMLVDFSGYGTYTTEVVPANGTALKWYWDSVHFKHELGDVIIESLLDEGAENFGVVLSQKNVTGQLASIREQQLKYRDAHPVEISRLRALHNDIVEMHLRNTAGKL